MNKSGKDSTDNYILFERRGNVALLTLNRPEVLNAWPVKMMKKFALLSFRVRGILTRAWS